MTKARRPKRAPLYTERDRANLRWLWSRYLRQKLPWLLLVLLMLGLVAYWPARKGWRLGVLPPDTSRQGLLAAHRNLGLVLALPLVLVLLTGIVLAYPAQTEQVLLEELRSNQATR